MFKKIAIIFIIVWIFALSSCTKTFDGYYYTLDLAREEIDCYEESDYIFTKQIDDINIDFVIKDESIYIVEFIVKGEENSQKYKKKTTVMFMLDEQISSFLILNDYDWNTSSKLNEAKYKWCIVPQTFNIENDNIECFEFVYKDKTYCLCYEFSTK